MRSEEEQSGRDDEVEPRESTEVLPKAGRRRFNQSYKDAILAKLDGTAHREKGEFLRSEGLFAKQAARWKQERKQGVSPKRGLSRRGRPPAATSEVRKKLASQERELIRLRRKLEQAEIIIDIQKKVAALLHTTDTDQEQP